MAANDTQVGGTHYKDQKIEPWDYIAANNIGYLEGNAIKYLTRWKAKDGLKDLNKAKHYIEKLIELEQIKQGIQPEPAFGSDEHIKQVVDRFLSWPLPQTFSPDCGIIFQKVNAPNSWPIGTNLFTAVEAEAMLRYLLAA